jgi:hypothetical protein
MAWREWQGRATLIMAAKKQRKGEIRKVPGQDLVLKVMPS